MYLLLNDLKVKHKYDYINNKIIYSLADFSSKDIKQDLCRLLIKGKDEDNDKFEMKVGVMRMLYSLSIFHIYYFSTS